MNRQEQPSSNKDESSVDNKSIENGEIGNQEPPLQEPTSSPYIINAFYNHIVGIENMFRADMAQIKTLAKEVKFPQHPERDGLHELIEIFENLLDKYKDESPEMVIPMITAMGNEDDPLLKNKDLKTFVTHLRSNLVARNRSDNFINAIAFTYLVATFEAALLDFLREMYQYDKVLLYPRTGTKKNPENQKFIAYYEALNAPDTITIQQLIIEKELISFGVGRSEESKMKRLNTLIGLSSPIRQVYVVKERFTEQEIGDIVEIFNTRNTHLHNRGVVGPLYGEMVNNYFSKLKNLKETDSEGNPYEIARSPSFHHNWQNIKKGEYMKITDEYLSYSIQLLEGIVRKLSGMICDRYVSKDEQAAIHEAGRKFANKVSAEKGR